MSVATRGNPLGELLTKHPFCPHLESESSSVGPRDPELQVSGVRGRTGPQSLPYSLVRAKQGHDLAYWFSYVPLKIQCDPYSKNLIIEGFHQIGAHSGAHYKKRDCPSFPISKRTRQSFHYKHRCFSFLLQTYSSMEPGI